MLERESSRRTRERERARMRFSLMREDGSPLFRTETFLLSRESEKERDGEDIKLLFCPRPSRSLHTHKR